MIWFLYNMLFVIGFLLLLPRFFLRMRKRGGYRKNFSQRLALFEPDILNDWEEGSRVWIHGVSVGEIYVAFRFMEAMRETRPDISFTLSTTTSTAHAIARERIQAPDVLIYFPVDIPPIMRRMLRLMKPRMLVLVETEFWPNLIRRCRRSDIPVVLINGRLSRKSFAGYRKLRVFTRRLLPQFNLLFMQSRQDRERIISLGAPPDNVRVPGSAKYEITQRDPEAEKMARTILRNAGISDDAPILLGASTWPGEEDILLDLYGAIRQEVPALALVLVPRHFERSGEVMDAIEKRYMTCQRRSEIGEAPAGSSDVFLVDTTGELKHFMACATVIFVGKSLTYHGGQNVIEPAIYRKPIVVGPNMENFPSIMEDFLAADALCQIQNEDELHAVLRTLLMDKEKRDALGVRAAELVKAKSGAVQKTLEQVLPLLETQNESAGY